MKNLTIAILAAASLFSFGCKKKGGDDVASAVAKSEQFAAEMCKCTDAACAEKVHAEYTKYGEEMKSKMAGKDQKLDDATTAKLMEAAVKYSECQTKVTTPAAAPTEGEGAAAPAEGEAAAEGAAADGDSAAADTAAAGDLPAECQEYKAAVEALDACDKLPAEAKAAQKQALEQATAAWAALPAEAKAQAAEGCKAATEGVKAAAAACN